MARRNDDTAGRILTWFVAALLIIATVAGVKYVLESDLKPKDDESSLIVPITSEEPPVSSEDEPPTSSEDSSSEEEVEPTPDDDFENLEVKGPFEKKPWAQHDLNFESDENISPLNKAAYRNSDDFGKITWNQRQYTFNSAKMGDGYEENNIAIQLGFPTATNESHEDNLGVPELSKRYTSYLMFDFKVKNNTGFEIDFINTMLYRSKASLPFENSDIHLIYRTNESLNWAHVPNLQGGMPIKTTIPADDLFYQFAIVLNTGNKQNNVVIGHFNLSSNEEPLDPQPVGLYRLQVSEANGITANHIILSDNYGPTAFEPAEFIQSKPVKYIDFRLTEYGFFDFSILFSDENGIHVPQIEIHIMPSLSGETSMFFENGIYAYLLEGVNTLSFVELSGGGV